MITLTNTPTQMTAGGFGDYNVVQRLDDNNILAELIKTFFKIKIPTGVAGTCDGNVLFTGISRGD